jgi:hypothetical protein
VSVENLAYLIVGVLAGGAITWLVQHIYGREPTRLLKRIDTRERAQFVEKHDDRARAVERADGNYGVDFTQSLAGTLTAKGSLTARLVRAEQEPVDGQGNATRGEEKPHPKAGEDKRSKNDQQE